MTRVVMMSMWKNDEQAYLPNRVSHLLDKTYPDLRWAWAVGDSSDGTEEYLRFIQSTQPGRDISVARCDTGIVGSDPHTRLVRLGATFNMATDQLLRDDDEMVIWHESDLLSPPNLVELLLGTGKQVVGGMPYLTLPDGRTIFYDTWGYRAHGEQFTPFYPFSPAYSGDGPFEVESVGSVYMYPAAAVRGPGGARVTDMAVVEFMWQLRRRGYSVWADPHLSIIQPTVLWNEVAGWERPLD